MTKTKELKKSPNAEVRIEKFNELSPELQEKAEEIIEWNKQDSKNVLMRRWELGNIILDVLDDTTSGGSKKYGSNAFKKLAEFVEEGESFLRQAAQIAKVFSYEQILELSTTTMDDGFTPFSFSHARIFSAIDDNEQRREIMRLTKKNCWSVKELSEYVVAEFGNRSQNPSGRAGKPKNIEKIIKQQLEFVEDFDNRNYSVWQAPDTSISAHIDKLPEEEYTEELAIKLEELARRMRKLADEAVKRAEEAEEKANQVKASLKTKIKSVEPKVNKKKKLTFFTKEELSDIDESDDDI